jgi:hypothetical protein
LEIHEELQDRVAMADDFRNLGLDLFESHDRRRSMEYLSKAETILIELEKKTGKEHPLIKEIREVTTLLAGSE